MQKCVIRFKNDSDFNSFIMSYFNNGGDADNVDFDKVKKSCEDNGIGYLCSEEPKSEG